MKLLRYYIICIFLLAGQVTVQAQVNNAEKILLDSFTNYLEYGFLIDSSYFISGEEGSCNKATIWKLDKKFNVVGKKHLIHDFYGISQILDMEKRDSSFQILTLQLESDDVVGNVGIKYYEVDNSLEILDSLFLPAAPFGNVINHDSTWIYQNNDSIIKISTNDGTVRQKVKFDYSRHPLISVNSDIVSWKDSMVFLIDSTLSIDTVYTGDPIEDIAVSDSVIFILTTDSVLLIAENDVASDRKSIMAPDEARQILYHPYLTDLVVFTAKNGVYYYDTESLQGDGMVQLFNDPAHEEDLNYTALEDGSILRLGTTLVKRKIQNTIMYGQEFGFIHRFDQDYSEDAVSRSNLALKELSLSDTYYGTEPKVILGDTTYIITQSHDSQLNWKITNAGSDDISTALVSTNALWGFNCAEAYNSRFTHGIILPPADSLEGIFDVYKNSDFPKDYTLKRFVYTAYPNEHYDSDFSDNQRTFKLRYILSSTGDGPDSHEIQIYPNPAINEIHILSKDNLTIRQIELLNLQGKVLNQATAGHPWSEVKISTSSVPEGMYLLRLLTPDGYVVKKVSVMH